MVNKILKDAIIRWFDLKFEGHEKFVYEDFIFLYENDYKYVDIMIDNDTRKLTHNPSLKIQFSMVFGGDNSLFYDLLVLWIEKNYKIDVYEVESDTISVNRIHRLSNY